VRRRTRAVVVAVGVCRRRASRRTRHKNAHKNAVRYTL
jgi:hypothetical protein